MVPDSSHQISARKSNEASHSTCSEADSLTVGVPVEEVAPIREELRQLARKRRELLQKMTALDQSVVRAYDDLDFAHRRLVEVVEMDNHPWMLGTQFHPEFTSRPTRPHPLFGAFVAAAKAHAGIEGPEPAAAEKSAVAEAG